MGSSQCEIGDLGFSPCLGGCNYKEPTCLYGVSSWFGRVATLTRTRSHCLRLKTLLSSLFHFQEKHLSPRRHSLAGGERRYGICDYTVSTRGCLDPWTASRAPVTPAWRLDA